MLSPQFETTWTEGCLQGPPPFPGSPQPFWVASGTSKGKIQVQRGPGMSKSSPHPPPPSRRLCGLGVESRSPGQSSALRRNVPRRLLPAALQRPGPQGGRQVWGIPQGQLQGDRITLPKQGWVSISSLLLPKQNQTAPRPRLAQPPQTYSHSVLPPPQKSFPQRAWHVTPWNRLLGT